MRLLLPLVIASLSSATVTFAQTSGSYKVISGGRGWYAQGRLLARGATVKRGVTMSGNAAAGELVLDCEPDWTSYACSTDKPCDIPPCDGPRPGVEVKRLGAFAKFNDSFFRREPREAAVLGVRAGGNPNEAVLLLDARGVHWGSALNRVVEGRYCLRLRALPSSSPAGARVFALNWDRETDAEGIGQAPNLVAGLYALDRGMPFSTTGCTVDPDARAAWVIVAAEAQFTSINSQWKDYASRFADLERSGISPAILSDLRHAALASLADSLPAK